MKKLSFLPLETSIVRHLQQGGLDSNDQVPENFISDGGGMPCRHCLRNIDKGERYLILAHRPFKSIQPYSEQGPIFLHARTCEAYKTTDLVPQMYLPKGQIMLRGYDKSERIVYGTGTVIKNNDIREIAESIFGNPAVEYIHARSASNNCYQFKITST